MTPDGRELTLPPAPAKTQPDLAWRTATDRVADLIAQSRSAATKRAYAADWRDFVGWCECHHRSPLPADPLTVAAYLAALSDAGRKPSTVRRRTAAIGLAHRALEHQSPTEAIDVAATLSGIGRARGLAQTKKRALTADLLRDVIKRIPDGTLLGLRDRALLLIGFAGALRRSEIVGLHINDVERHPRGVLLHIRRSKTDQSGEGRIKAIPFGKKLRPVAALEAWLAAARANDPDSPLFRGVRGSSVLAAPLSTMQVSRIVKARVARAGLDPAQFSGHSLRAGYATTAAEHGAGLTDIANHVGHAKLDTTRGYVRTADLFKKHSGSGFL